VLDGNNGESMSAISVEVRNEDIIRKNLEKTGEDLPRYLQGARIEITDGILNTKGLRSYPGATEANMPPVPFYIRGRGMQYKSGNNNKSQRLGTRWQSIPYGKIGMKISNPVTYAPYVHGEHEQAGHMAKKGWKKLFSVAKQKTGFIRDVYNKWVDQLLRKHGLL
jgi:hypothetical protein